MSRALTALLQLRRINLQAPPVANRFRHRTALSVTWLKATGSVYFARGMLTARRATGRNRRPRTDPGLRRQRLSGTCADQTGPRLVPGRGLLKAMGRGTSLCARRDAFGAAGPDGQAVGQLVLPSKSGKPLGWSDTKVRKVAARRRRAVPSLSPQLRREGLVLLRQKDLMMRTAKRVSNQEARWWPRPSRRLLRKLLRIRR